jgi:hypothetical protein
MPQLGGSSASPVSAPLTGTLEVPFRNDTYGTAQDIANLAGAPAASVEFASDADITLTQAQYQAESITFTDSPTTLTTGRNVVFPAHFPTKYVKNSTLQTLTLKKSGQTGVTIAAGGTAIVASGTSDVVVGPGASAVTSVNGVSGAITVYDTWGIAVSDETTAITAGTGKMTFYAPYACTIDEVFTGLSTQSSSGVVTTNVKKNGTTIFSTSPSIDASEDTSLTGTAAALSTTALSKGDKITVDIDAAGTGAKGLKVFFRVHY